MLLEEEQRISVVGSLFHFIYSVQWSKWRKKRLSQLVFFFSSFLQLSLALLDPKEVSDLYYGFCILKACMLCVLWYDNLCMYRKSWLQTDSKEAALKIGPITETYSTSSIKLFQKTHGWFSVDFILYLSS